MIWLTLWILCGLFASRLEIIKWREFNAYLDQKYGMDYGGDVSRFWMFILGAFTLGPLGLLLSWADLRENRKQYPLPHTDTE